MMRLNLVALLLLAASAACAPRAAVATEPPANVDPVDATADDQSAEAWLKRVEDAAQQIDYLRADVRWTRIQGLLGDEQRRFGELWYDAGPPRRYAVHFDRLILDEALYPQDRRYIFDGRWLAEHNREEKLFTRRELRSEAEAQRDAADEASRGLLDEGPFLLPLDLNRRRVLERFEVERVEPSADDPPDTVRLRLTPRDPATTDASHVDFWFDRQTALPRRVHSVEEDAETESIIDLTDVETGTRPNPDTFDTSPPDEPGWTVQVYRLEDNAP